ncbi:MAG: hypothetical protein WC061_01800 [Melioribacteraceae bacterium]
MKKSFVSLIMIILLTGCAASQKTSAEKEVILKKFSADRFGASSETFYNSDSTYALIVGQSKSTSLNPNPVLRFFVYDIKGEVIVIEDGFSSGRVFWKDKSHIEVTVTHGIVSAEDDDNISGYIYDVSSGTRSALKPASQR